MKLRQFFRSEGNVKFLTLIVLAVLFTSVFALMLFVEQDEATPGSVRVNVIDDNDIDGVPNEDDVYGEKVFAIDDATGGSQVLEFEIRLTNPAGSSRDVNMSVLDKSLSDGGNVSLWGVRFLTFAGDEEDFYTIGGGESLGLKVEIRPPDKNSPYELGEDNLSLEATFLIGGNEKFTKTAWSDINQTNFLTENFTYNNITLKVLVGKKNIAPMVEKGEGEESFVKTTPPNRYTNYTIKITNVGSKTDSFELDGEFTGETRGAIGEGWFVKFDPTDFIENLKSLDSTELSVGIKPPKDAERGTYQAAIQIRSTLSARLQSITLTAKVPKPELDIIQLSASPSPALDNVDSIDLRVKVKNTGSYVPGDIGVSFAVQYDENEGWTPVGQTTIQGLESAETKTANITFELTLPDVDKKQLRVIKYRAEVDENGQIAEDNKNNNIEETELEIVLATKKESSFASGSAAFFISLGVAAVLVSGSFYKRYRRTLSTLEKKKE